MKNSTMLRLIIMTAALTLALGAAACDSNNSKIKSVNNSNNEEPESNNAKGDSDASDKPDASDKTDIGLADEEGHGSEPGEIEHIEPGFMNGSWRVGAVEQDRPVVYFDTFQDEGDPEITGEFVMGNALYDGGVDGESGEIVEGGLSGDALTLKWNPTTDPDEMFTLNATRTDENLLEGKITAARNTELDYPVTVTRQENK